MKTLENSDAKVSHQGSAIAAAAWLQRHSWWVGGVLLIVVVGIAYHKINADYIHYLEDAADQIPIGSEWRTIWTADENWKYPVIMSTSDFKTLDHHYGGGPSTRLRYEMGGWLCRNKFGVRWSSPFFAFDRSEIRIRVDQKGDGQVIGVCVRGVWRTAKTPSNAPTLTAE